MKLCLSQATILGTTTARAVESAARAGFEHIDLWWPMIRDGDENFDSVRSNEIRAKEEISFASLSGVNLELAGGDEAWQASLADFRRAIAFATEVGVPLICFSPGSKSQIQADQTFSLAVRRLAGVLELIDQVPIDLALEFQADSGWIASLPTAVAFVSMFDAERLGVCFDAFEYYCGPSKLEDLTPEVVARIRSVQLSDLISVPREFAAESDRILPGEGDFDLRSILGCLRAADYDGLLCVESPNPMLWQFAPDRVADMAHQSLLRFFVPADTEH